jgi:hypothetical protein
VKTRQVKAVNLTPSPTLMAMVTATVMATEVWSWRTFLPNPKVFRPSHLPVGS